MVGTKNINIYRTCYQYIMSMLQNEDATKWSPIGKPEDVSSPMSTEFFNGGILFCLFVKQCVPGKHDDKYKANIGQI